MSGNAEQYVFDLKAIADKMQVDVLDLAKMASLYALRNVVLGTRVDTGRARGNWQLSQGAAPIGFYDEDLKDPSGGETISRGTGVVQELRLNGGTIWLVNGVPYVVYLEEKDKMVEGTFNALDTWLTAQGFE